MQTVQDDSVAPTSGDHERSGVAKSLAHAQANGRTAPVDGVERWPIERLLPYAGNPKTHPPEQVALIAKSMARFGQAQIILIDGDEGPTQGEIIAGHGRVLAAVQLGWDSLAVGMARGWSAEEKKAYRIADNALAAAPWDMELLKPEVQFLNAASFDVSTLGFDAPSMRELLVAEPALDANAESAPALPQSPVVQAGDLWVLGNHRLLCGDATNAGNVARLLEGEKIDMMLTDPPYCSGGFQEAGKSAGSVGTRGIEMVVNDTLSTRGYMALMKGVIPFFAAKVVYIFTDWRMWVNLFDVVESSGYGVRNMVVWDKGTPGMGAGWRMQHELIMCGIRVKSPFNPQKAQGNVISSKRTGNKLHAVEKPVDLLQKIMDVTDMAKTVGDPFCGSGSVVIAAEMTGRSCYALEIDPGYAQVSIERWQKYTGKEATLEGRTFEEIKAERS